MVPRPMTSLTTQPLDLSALSDFQLVAAHGGFGPASRASGRSKATLSRRLAEFEAALGVRLFERGERGLRLTAAGQDLQARAAAPIEALVEALDLVPRAGGALSGLLRVSAANAFAHVHLVRIAASFSLAHPLLRLEVVADDRFVDPVEEGFDVVIRANPSPDERLVGRRLFRTERVAVAAPGLAPPSDGEAAPLLYRTPETPPPFWRLRREPEECWSCALRPVMGLSSLLMMREAAVAGAGVALLPNTLIASDLASGRLASWGSLDDRTTDVWALHTSRRFVSPKVRAFMDCLEQEFPVA